MTGMLKESLRHNIQYVLAPRHIDINHPSAVNKIHHRNVIKIGMAICMKPLHLYIRQTLQCSQTIHFITMCVSLVIEATLQCLKLNEGIVNTAYLQCILYADFIVNRIKIYPNKKAQWRAIYKAHIHRGEIWSVNYYSELVQIILYNTWT